MILCWKLNFTVELHLEKTSLAWSQGHKTFLAQQRLKFILLINVIMPIIIGILTFIGRMNYWL